MGSPFCCSDYSRGIGGDPEFDRTPNLASHGHGGGIVAYVFAIGVWIVGWWLNIRLSHSAQSDTRTFGLLIPAIFGLTIVLMWEILVQMLDVSAVILPPPSAIAARFAESLHLLWADFVQTILKGAMTGYVFGALAAFAVAILADRSPFLTKGILPVGAFMAALPIVGTAPIFVKWLGSDWQSKAAVVGVMVFFPILVNTVAGLKDNSAMQRDLMRTYGAGYWPTLFKLRLPAAMPFIFNGLKISTTLALIG
ncbi:unnamed protein product, partial [Ectocarpus sp. 12 AP-2014]